MNGQVERWTSAFSGFGRKSRALGWMDSCIFGKGLFDGVGDDGITAHHCTPHGGGRKLFESLTMSVLSREFSPLNIYTCMMLLLLQPLKLITYLSGLDVVMLRYPLDSINFNSLLF